MIRTLFRRPRRLLDVMLVVECVALAWWAAEVWSWGEPPGLGVRQLWANDRRDSIRRSIGALVVVVVLLPCLWGLRHRLTSGRGLGLGLVWGAAAALALTAFRSRLGVVAEIVSDRVG